MGRPLKKASKYSLSHLKLRFSWLRRWLKKNPDPMTLLLMTKGNLEVQKIHLSPKWIKVIKLSTVGSAFFLFVSGIIFIHFLVTLPDHYRLEQENLGLKTELNKLQFHLDTLQTTVDRVRRFNQKLRALTDVDKRFAQERGPLGQGGGELDVAKANQEFSFGDFNIQKSSLNLNDDSPEVLERRERFMVERLYSWMTRLYRDSELENQSVEELYEVLNGRRIQLASTPSIMPVHGWITSGFGYRLDPFTGRRAFHNGLDIAAREGTPVLAPADGVVSFAGPYGGYGNAVMVFHGYGVSTLYGHNQEILVRAGQRVKRGDILATVGQTGRATGPHVHYEVIVHGVKVDPRRFILDRSL